LLFLQKWFVGRIVEMNQKVGLERKPHFIPGYG
jgi:hypothetical protein